MAAKHFAPNSPENRAKRAYKALSGCRNTLYQRMSDYILSNRSRLRDEVGGTETTCYSLQQLDELFLSKMNVLDRAMCELARPEPKEGQTTTTTYETVEVIAKREELPQKIADALAERGESDFLDLCVLRADEHVAEVLLVLAREDHEVPAQPATPNKKEQDGQSGQSGQSDIGDDLPNGL
ncbi:MAG TPA: hypothetical protein VKX17_10550 [Planctomycetota bacterium]|nr:hypothetical protein [Planctomycetota bacterium]